MMHRNEHRDAGQENGCAADDQIEPAMAGAMVVGMLPMAIGGPGEEQNAVLARAVIGGVLVGTITTLLFVPYLYSVFGAFERVAERRGKIAGTPSGLSHEGLRT